MQGFQEKVWPFGSERRKGKLSRTGEEKDATTDGAQGGLWLPAEVVAADRLKAHLLWLLLLSLLVIYVVYLGVNSEHRRGNPPVTINIKAEPFKLPDVIFCPTAGDGCDTSDPEKCAKTIRVFISSTEGFVEDDFYKPPPPAPTPPPTPGPAPEGTAAPTPLPTTAPTQSPTMSPTPRPTLSPTPRPTLSPTLRPTPSPTLSPTPSPTTSAPLSQTPAPTPHVTPAGTMQTQTPEPTAQYVSPGPIQTQTPAPTAQDLSPGPMQTPHPVAFYPPPDTSSTFSPSTFTPSTLSPTMTDEGMITIAPSAVLAETPSPTNAGTPSPTVPEFSINFPIDSKVYPWCRVANLSTLTIKQGQVDSGEVTSLYASIYLLWEDEIAANPLPSTRRFLSAFLVEDGDNFQDATVSVRLPYDRVNISGSEPFTFLSNDVVITMSQRVLLTRGGGKGDIKRRYSQATTSAQHTISLKGQPDFSGAMLYATFSINNFEYQSVEEIDPVDLWALLGVVGGMWEIACLIFGMCFITTQIAGPTRRWRFTRQSVQELSHPSVNGMRGSSRRQETQQLPPPGQRPPVTLSGNELT